MGAYSYLLSMGYPCLPASVWMDMVELVMVLLVMLMLLHDVSKAVACRDCGGCIDDVGTGTVKSYRIE